MIFRSLFAFILIINLFICTINAINPAYFRERHHDELVDANSSDLDDERPAYVAKQNNDNEDNDDDYYIIKRNKFTNFHISPLWLSRRTRTNRFYGKPLWISRTG